MSDDKVTTIRLETRLWNVKGKDEAEKLKKNLQRFSDANVKIVLTNQTLENLRKEGMKEEILGRLSRFVEKEKEFPSEEEFWSSLSQDPDLKTQIDPYKEFIWEYASRRIEIINSTVETMMSQQLNMIKADIKADLVEMIKQEKVKK